MSHPTTIPHIHDTTAPHERRGAPLLHLAQMVEHAAHLLPAQGPITVFIHHNTLHAFEDLTFDQAVQRGGEIFGCQAYMTEAKYRECLAQGRIRRTDLPQVLRTDLGPSADDQVAGLCTRLELRLAMLEYPLRFGPPEELAWLMAESDALKRVRSDASLASRGLLITETKHWVLRDLRANGAKKSLPAGMANLLDPARMAAMESWQESDWESLALTMLWQQFRHQASLVPPPPAPAPKVVRHRDWLLAQTGIDADAVVHDCLIRFCAAFVDQGFSHWNLPHRNEGFWASFGWLHGQAGIADSSWQRLLATELRRLSDQQIDPLACIHESLELLAVPEHEWDDYLAATLLALRGWAGMIHQLEERGDRVRYAIRQGSLVEFLAVRLLLDRVVVASIANDAWGDSWSFADRSPEPATPITVDQRAFTLFQLAQLFGWSAARLRQLRPEQWNELWQAIESFNERERQRLFHQAYERKFYTQTLDAIALHATQPAPTPERPRFQAVFCIDDREESMRRHVEEIAPDAATYSMAGFFAVPMYFRGLADAHFAALCPVVIRPHHWVIEQVDERHAEKHQRWSKSRRVLGLASHRVTAGSRAFALGALLTAIIGVLACIPLIARVWSPRLTARLRHRTGSLMRTPRHTRLVVERRELTCGPAGGQLGFSLDEMTTMAERVLRDLGLTTHWARIVLIVGHGSSSVNNPHESAYDCGACGGARGGPNARAMAHILNHPKVRSRLAERGLVLPSDSHFVGVFHNTGNDSLMYFDLDQVPESHRGMLATIRQEMELVCQRNAHERCRRFMSAPLSLSPAAARQHVEARTEDLAQVRPELGHATNAICIVGRRCRTRGLFLDRRAFLNSYDPTQDDAQGSILAGILRAAVPVCGGINLEYFFSYIDSAGYGCGSKLPHNITSLLGVMDGAGSDLRTGLPWQMVEIHEPVRLLFVIETPPEIILGIMDRNPVIATYIRHEWVQLALLDPDSPAILTYQHGTFLPYVPTASDLARAPTSVDWYRGWRDHLEFAAIG